jgi:plastocyanin
VTHVVAEIGSSDILAAVLFGTLASVAAGFLLWTVPKRVGPVQVIGTLVVIGLVVVGLRAAFRASPPAANTSSSVAAGGFQFPPVGPSPSGLPSVSPSPSSSSSPQGAACRPSGATSITVDAPVGASVNGFAQTCLAVPPGKDFTVTFKNEDTGIQHTWALFKDSTATDLLGGAPNAAAFITGPAQTTYQLNALPAGTYFYRCDIHPTVMTGTFVVG